VNRRRFTTAVQGRPDELVPPDEPGEPVAPACAVEPVPVAGQGEPVVPDGLVLRADTGERDDPDRFAGRIFVVEMP